MSKEHRIRVLVLLLMVFAYSTMQHIKIERLQAELVSCRGIGLEWPDAPRR